METVTVAELIMEAMPRGWQVPFERLESRRARQAWLRVHAEGRVTLTVPTGMHEGRVTAFVLAKADWLRQALARAWRFRNDTFLPRDRRAYVRDKESARVLVHAHLDAYGAKYGHRWKKVFIKDLRRNWGSCSERNNLNFNYKLLHLPPHLAAYVVFHELCHLDAFDHSPRFWALVAREFPTYRALRKELRAFHP